MQETGPTKGGTTDTFARESLAAVSALAPEQVAGWQAEARGWAETDCWVVDA